MRKKMNEDIKMSVSQVFVKNGEKYAFVSFTDGTRNAEGRIPDCRITFNRGFEEEEISRLEDYMKKELPNLKKMASGVNLLSALTKE